MIKIQLIDYLSHFPSLLTQCSIDLKRNLLSIGTTGTETKFLGEAELPVCARLNRTEAPDTATLESEDRQLAEALTKSAESAAGKKIYKAAISLPFNLHCKAIAVLFFISYCRPT